MSKTKMQKLGAWGEDRAAEYLKSKGYTIMDRNYRLRGGKEGEIDIIANHVKEDVIQILLNLKKLKFVLPDDQPQVVSLEVKGEKEVTGRDFELTPQVKLVNPGEHIATLTSSKAQLAINITIESGVGYQTVESRESGKSLANEIVLDAAFSPIEKIAYQVENMRVGDKTNFNRIFLTIETNGSITPEKALIEASGLLEEHFKLIASSFQLSETKKTKKTEKTEDAKKMKIADMGLSARITASLEAGGIKTVAGLISKTTKAAQRKASSHSIMTCRFFCFAFANLLKKP